MSNDYDIEMSLDDTLELDTIVEKSSRASDPISRVEHIESNSNYNLTGIQTHTSLFDPPQSGVFEIDINGQTLKINVLDSSSISNPITWDDKKNWTEIDYGIKLSTNKSKSGDQSARNGSVNGPFSISTGRRDGGYHNKTETDSPKEATISSKRWIDDRGNDDNSAGYYFRYQDIDNYYCSGLGINQSQFWVVKQIDGNFTGVGTAGISSIPTKQWIDHKVEMNIDDNSNLVFNLYINGSKWATISDNSPSLVNGGAVGIGMGASDGNQANGNTAYMQCYTDQVRINY